MLPLLVLVPFVLLVNGIGEELGWRGYLADHLLRERSLPATAFLVAVAWGLWHLPLFWVVADFRQMGWLVPGWFLGLLAGSVVLTWLYRGSGGSVLLVALWHTPFNLVTATPGTSSTVAPVVSTVVRSSRSSSSSASAVSATGRSSTPPRCGSQGRGRAAARCRCRSTCRACTSRARRSRRG